MHETHSLKSTISTGLIPSKKQFLDSLPSNSVGPEDLRFRLQLHEDELSANHSTLAN